MPTYHIINEKADCFPCATSFALAAINLAMANWSRRLLSLFIRGSKSSRLHLPEPAQLAKGKNPVEPATVCNGFWCQQKLCDKTFWMLYHIAGSTWEVSSHINVDLRTLRFRAHFGGDAFQIVLIITLRCHFMMWVASYRQKVLLINRHLKRSSRAHKSCHASHVQ